MPKSTVSVAQRARRLAGGGGGGGSVTAAASDGGVLCSVCLSREKLECTEVCGESSERGAQKSKAQNPPHAHTHTHTHARIQRLLV